MDNQNSILRDLTSAFEELGVKDAESWARSEVEVGLPQLATCLFLALANAPIDRLSEPRALRQLLEGVAQKPVVEALGRLLSTSSAEDVLQVLRWSLRAYLNELCFLLDDTAAMRFPREPKNHLLTETSWGLFRTNETGQPVAQMGGLHEVVFEFFAAKE